MYKLPTVINSDAITQYVSDLYNRINESEYLIFKQVTIDGQSPLAKKCHENAMRFVELNPTYKVIFGWICVDGGVMSPSIIFLAHSAIQDATGKTYEITPIESIEPRPFLKAKLNENDFANLVNDLENRLGTAKLVYHK